jgi:hypothetical protein
MMWSLPIFVEIGGTKYPIRNKCDFRVVLDVISSLSDEELEMEQRVECALFQFYGNDELNTLEKVLLSLNDIQTAIMEMMKIINLGEETTEEEQHKPQLMDWEHDFTQLAPPISRTLGYSVRDAKNYTHWYDFIGAYMEIGDCTFANIISIRNKRMKGKKLEDWEQEFYRENKKIIDLPHKLTDEEQEWLDSDW